MRKRRKPCIRAGMACLLTLGLASGCGALRSEFFRGETDHLLAEGNRHYRSGAFKEAASCYDRAVALDPACARGHTALGHVAYVGGRFQEALRCYDRAVDLDPRLEATLAPLILDARRMEEQQALEACGASLQKVLALLSKGREDEVEALLREDVPTDMLARHATSLPTKGRDRLLELAEERGRSGTVPPCLALFYGHLLAADERHGFLATRLLESAAPRVEGEARQKAYLTLGALYIRLGREQDAAWAYEAALEAGCPREEVVPLLADLYGMPADAVAPTDEKESEGPAPAEDAPPPVVSHGNLSGSLHPPKAVRSESPVSASHAKGPGADRAVVARPGMPPINPDSQEPAP